MWLLCALCPAGPAGKERGEQRVQPRPTMDRTAMDTAGCTKGALGTLPHPPIPALGFCPISSRGGKSVRERTAACERRWSGASSGQLRFQWGREGGAPLGGWKRQRQRQPDPAGLRAAAPSGTGTERRHGTNRAMLRAPPWGAGGAARRLPPAFWRPWGRRWPQRG